MRLTLRDLDVLEIAPYGKESVKMGDIILFRLPDLKKTVAHRVIGLAANGIWTRSDNSLIRDPWIIRDTEIIGRVVAVWRGKKRRKVTGGRVGLLTAGISYWRNAFIRHILRLLHPICTKIAQQGIIYNLVPNGLRARIVVFRFKGRENLRLLAGKRIVGQYDPCRHQWEIRWFFQLFVDRKMLKKEDPC